MLEYSLSLVPWLTQERGLAVRDAQIISVPQNAAIQFHTTCKYYCLYGQLSSGFKFLYGYRIGYAYIVLRIPL
jgi:hypothetical protein